MMGNKKIDVNQTNKYLTVSPEADAEGGIRYEDIWVVQHERYK